MPLFSKIKKAKGVEQRPKISNVASKNQTGNPEKALLLKV